MENFKRAGFLIGLVILFGGLNLAILLSHLSRIFGILLIFAGLGIIFLTTKDDGEDAKESKKEKSRRGKSLGSRAINLFTLEGALKPYFPLFGILMFAVDIVFNAFFSSTSQLGSNDYVVLLLAGTLLLYNYVPRKYDVEKDFAMIFIFLLFIILVIPTTLYSAACSTEPDTNSIFTYYLLAAPTTALVRLFGIETTMPEYNVVYMTGPEGEGINLFIGLSCTGLYSVAIFVSAFIAFVAIEYPRFNRKVGILLALGIFLAWVANIIRMAIIIVVGRYYGNEAMEWTHNNIGEIIFMVWVSLFWVVMFKYLGIWEDIDGSGKPTPPPKILRKKGEVVESERSRARTCDLCNAALSHTIPAYRCGCGKIYHLDCTKDIKNCPACHREIERE